MYILRYAIMKQLPMSSSHSPHHCCTISSLMGSSTGSQTPHLPTFSSPFQSTWPFFPSPRRSYSWKAGLLLLATFFSLAALTGPSSESGSRATALSVGLLLWWATGGDGIDRTVEHVRHVWFVLLKVFRLAKDYKPQSHVYWREELGETHVDFVYDL